MQPNRHNMSGLGFEFNGGSGKDSIHANMRPDIRELLHFQLRIQEASVRLVDERSDQLLHVCVYLITHM